MNKIIEYRTIHEFSQKSHEIKVNQAILEGWQPLGGINVILASPKTSTEFIYSQALVKYRPS
jgi:hypothetical protein